MRQVYIDDDGAVKLLVPEYECTGVAARWCPIHGDCTDKGEEAEREPYSDHCSDRECPLHGENSTHAS